MSILNRVFGLIGSPATFLGDAYGPGKAKSSIHERLPILVQELGNQGGHLRKNAELTDELQVLQEELDEARIVAEKARSTTKRCFCKAIWG